MAMATVLSVGQVVGKFACGACDVAIAVMSISHGVLVSANEYQETGNLADAGVTLASDLAVSALASRRMSASEAEGDGCLWVHLDGSNPRFPKQDVCLPTVAKVHVLPRSASPRFSIHLFWRPNS